MPIGTLSLALLGLSSWTLVAVAAGLTFALGACQLVNDPPAAGSPATRSTPDRRSGFAEIAEGRIAWEARGAGPSGVVFVHGNASERRDWHFQMDGVATDRALVSVDLLGCGESDKPEVTYSMGLHARSIVAVMEVAGLERAVLVGHSNGAPAVRQCYRDHRDRVEALVLVDGPLRQSLSPEVAAWMRSLLERPDAEQALRAMVESMPLGRVPPADARRMRDAQLAVPPHVQRSTLDAVMDPELWAEDGIDVPLLVVDGPPQPTTPPDREAFVRGLAPHVEYHLWDDVSHFLMLEEPDRFNRLLEAFLTRVDAAPR